MVVDHIGYAVKDIYLAKREFTKFGYEFEELIKDTDRNLLICFGHNESYCIELIQTLDDELNSPVKEILKKNGPVPYHLCYRTNEIEKDISRLQSEKWVLVTPPQRAIAFGKNARVAFLLNRNIGLVELVEK